MVGEDRQKPEPAARGENAWATTREGKAARLPEFWRCLEVARITALILNEDWKRARSRGTQSLLGGNNSAKTATATNSTLKT